MHLTGIAFFLFILFHSKDFSKTSTCNEKMYFILNIVPNASSIFEKAFHIKYVAKNLLKL